MRFVLDASAAVKLYAPEEGAAEMLDLLERGADFTVPDIFPLELASALLRKERGGEVVVGTAQRALLDLDLVGLEVVPHAPILTAAAALASQYQHGIFDCLYLLVAKDRAAPVVTFDAPMSALARRLGIQLWEPPR